MNEEVKMYRYQRWTISLDNYILMATSKQDAYNKLVSEGIINHSELYNVDTMIEEVNGILHINEYY